MKLLDVQDIHSSVGGTTILNGITFAVAPGETVGVIGPNGSGKTTLFNCLSGFLPITKGTLHLKGEDITRLAPHRRAEKGIGRIFQNFGIFREMTLLENVVIALEGRQSWLSTALPWSKESKANRETAADLLCQVNLQSKAKQKAGSLSGGQMRLLEIIRALAFGAELFLLDEPTAGVSPKMKEEVIGLIQKVKTLGKTVIVIEHDINFIAQLCERIVVLDGGRVVMDDTPSKVRADPRLQEIYFGRHTATA